MTYVLLMVFGFIGLVVMALMGSIRAGSHHAIRHVGARAGHPIHPSPAHAGHAAARSHAPQPRASPGIRGRAAFLLPGISPIDVMAMAMGAGAMGIIGRKVLHNETAAVVMAIGGALVIDVLVVRPLFQMLMRFASKPSEGLEGMISQVAEAATTFDSQGRGLIKLTLDGQTSQVLATLEPGELAAGISVKRGDFLVVLEVDATRNACRVSREIASQA